MVNKKTWNEFRDAGLLWWINMILHTFGWAIVIEVGDNNEITNAYPARVEFRGFNENSNTSGYQKVAQYMNDNSEDILKESKS